MSEEHDEAPWTEEQWEQFMKTADLRTARYGELMETLFDDPNRDEIVGQEMGWNRREPDPEFEQIIEQAQRDVEETEERGEDIIEQVAREQDPGEMLPESVLGSEAEDLDATDRQLRRLPAYHLSEKLSRRIDALLMPHMDKHEDDNDEDVAQAFIQIKIASVKISGGHAMGYRDEVIGGNVVNCKRALAAADECRLALASLRKRKVFPPGELDSLLKELETVRSAIERRVAELRARMWWQQGK